MHSEGVAAAERVSVRGGSRGGPGAGCPTPGQPSHVTVPRRLRGVRAQVTLGPSRAPPTHTRTPRPIQKQIANITSIFSFFYS